MLQKTLAKAKSVAIGGHMRPDGDCVGSCMAMYQYICTWYPEIRVDVYLEEIPNSFRFIEATQKISHEIKDTTYDLFISLDCGDEGRLGFSAPLFKNARETFCVDHHVSNSSFGKNNYIKPDASSTCELVFELMEEEKITKQIAECLYLGIVHDTGVFQYSCTSPETMIVASKLMAKGIDYSKIIHDTYYEKTYVQNQILGRALLESVLFMERKCIVSVIDKKIMDFYGATSKDLEGIVSQLRLTSGVNVAVFLYELQPHEFKISLRSDDTVDVSKVAGYFGGGGHRKAAGLTLRGTAHDVINNIAKQIELQLQKK
ncbi:DHH family phosphoesterase [Faecalimonas sp.]